MAEQREQFDKCYPPEPWAIRANGEAGKAIHFSHLKREWEGFQKGWDAALAQAPRQSEQWGGTQQRDELKPCPFCGTKAISQGRLADNSTEQQWRIQCGNPFCTMKCMTQTCASYDDAVACWENRRRADAEPVS